MQWKAIITVGFLLFFPGSFLAAQPAQGEGSYYYSDGGRIDLKPAEDWIAVRFDSPSPPIQPPGVPPAVDFTARRDLSGNRLSLLPVQDHLPAAMRAPLLADLAAMAEVELVAPVYRSNGALMIVTDQFVARFAAGISKSVIDAINLRHGVEVVKILRRSSNTWVLRVVKGDALKTANTYHILAEVAYAHPDFVRVIPPRPANLHPGDERMIIAPDGSLLPPDTAVEKGRNDLRIIESASLVFPGQATGLISPASATPATRVTIKSEGFEGAFPNDWVLYGATTWDPESYRLYSGSYSGYGQGTNVSPPGPYSPNQNSWMVYGPFSLSDAIDARFDLQAWVETEVSSDYLFIGASVNGANFYGIGRSGDWASHNGGEGWMNIALDLKRIPTIGDLTGLAEVWVGIAFTSDGAINYEGVYVDDIVLEKITGGYHDLTSDEFDDLQWSLNNNQQLWGTDGADIQAVDAWGITTGSSTITIAILDEGVDLAHPDLAVKLVTGYDATGGGSAGGPSNDDAHGTACAGIAGAITDNALGVAGIDRTAKIMPVRIAYSDATGAWISTDSWIADAIDWAVANGADVLSNSWGGGSPATLITDAIADARTTGRGGLGSVVLFAAGNNNDAILYPATLDTVLAVGATSPCDERTAPTSCDGEWWWGSNYGPQLDIAAPGVHMYTTDISGTAGYDAGDYAYNFNGTSSATPVVAGVAGLLLGNDPTLTVAGVEAQLMATADDLDAPGWDQRTGFGRVNAYRALTETLPACYELSISHTGLGNNPDTRPVASPGCAASWFYAGEIVTLTASPSPGWMVSGWSGTGDDSSILSTNSLTMPSTAHSASVSYTQIPCYTLTLSHSGSGADPIADLAGSPACSAGDYHAGEALELLADPADGWAISAWSGTDDDAIVAPGNTLTMPAAHHAAEVSYVVVPAGCYVLHRNHTGSGNEITPTPWNSPACPGSTYIVGETISLAADPAGNWTVGGWTGTGYDGSFLWTNSVDMPSSDHTVTVHYVTPTLVKDLRPGPYGAFNRGDGSKVSYTTPVSIGSTLFFAANDGVHGMELWKSDGTAVGTSMVKDIWPGAESAFPWSTSDTWFSQTFVNVNGTLFFVARDGIAHDYEIWKSDGTTAGTMMVKDIYDSWDKIPGNLINVNDSLFFSHTNGVDGVELWKSDGSEAGTEMVRNIATGAASSSPQYFAAFGNLLVFSAYDAVDGREPWISDGTEGGTVRLKDINVAGNSNPRWFEEAGGVLYFSADDGTIGKELWKSDGTDAGTVLVKDISPEGGGINRGSDPNLFTGVNGTLFFRAKDSIGAQVNHGRELWKSDGTEAGTSMVKNIGPGYSDGSPMELTEVAGNLIFIADDNGGSNRNFEPWISDGTEAGTQRIAETYPGLNPINYIPRNFEAIGDTVFFASWNPFNGKELWQTDGTAIGTRMVLDIWAGEPSSYPDWLTNADGTLFFRADDGIRGSEIWALTAGSPGSSSSCILNMVSDITVDSTAAFEACDILVVGPSFTVEDGASVDLSSGWEIQFMPGFTIKQGASMNARVCGQSLCTTSASPMPYGCHPCVNQICAIDPACCISGFTQACVDKVATDCGLVCE